MNSFLSPMTEIITERKGTIDKYIGDCIMAFWNAPLDDPDHAKNAVQAAQAMRRKLVELNLHWQAETAYRSFSPSGSVSASTPANVSSAISARSSTSITRCSATR
jgi:adenylate cyclase